MKAKGQNAPKAAIKKNLTTSGQRRESETSSRIRRCCMIVVQSPTGHSGLVLSALNGHWCLVIGAWSPRFDAVSNACFKNLRQPSLDLSYREWSPVISPHCSGCTQAAFLQQELGELA